MGRDAALARGARNLLVNCAGLGPGAAGANLVIVHEEPALGWYDLEAPLAVAGEARRLGMAPALVRVGAPGNEPDPRAVEAVAEHDCAIFFSRMGDQDRFEAPVPGKTIVMCYARDAAMLGSAYGGTDHRALLDLKAAVNRILLRAGRIRISCPLGTDLVGAAATGEREEGGEVSVRRFPMGVHQPMNASGFSGRVALARYLTTTGSKVYEPASLALATPVMAEVEAGRLAGLDGDAAIVDRIRAHYRMVAEKFGLEAGAVHSWHAGIHPGSAYTVDAAEDPDRWANNVFTNPRFVHFHTCGARPPGEICWTVLDPTIEVDGTALWERGRLRADAFPLTRECLARWPELAPLFKSPSDAIGSPAPIHPPPRAHARPGDPSRGDRHGTRIRGKGG